MPVTFDPTDLGKLSVSTTVEQLPYYRRYPTESAESDITRSERMLNDKIARTCQDMEKSLRASFAPKVTASQTVLRDLVAHFGRSLSELAAAPATLPEVPFDSWMEEVSGSIRIEVHRAAAIRFVPRENESVLRQLEALEQLQQNWDGYNAEPINQVVIEAAKDFVQNYPGPLPTIPQVVPMTMGRLQFEWHKGDRSLELEFETPTQVHYLKWDPSQGVEEEDVLPLTETSRIQELVEWFVSGAEPHVG